MKPSQSQKLMATACAGVILILVVVRLAFPDAQTIEVATEGGGFSLQVEQGELPQAELLARIWSDPASRAAAIAWLRDSAELYHVEDRELPQHLARLLPDERRRELRDTIVRIATTHPVISELRQRASSRLAPFQILGSPAVAVVPGADAQPSQFFVSVRSSSFSGARLEVYNPVTDRRLVLSGFPGISGLSSADLHLNPCQARYLGIIPDETPDTLWVEPFHDPGLLEDPTGPVASPTIPQKAAEYAHKGSGCVQGSSPA